MRKLIPFLVSVFLVVSFSIPAFAVYYPTLNARICNSTTGEIGPLKISMLDEEGLDFYRGFVNGDGIYSFASYYSSGSGRRSCNYLVLCRYDGDFKYYKNYNNVPYKYSNNDYSYIVFDGNTGEPLKSFYVFLRSSVGCEGAPPFNENIGEFVRRGINNSDSDIFSSYYHINSSFFSHISISVDKLNVWSKAFSSAIITDISPDLPPPVSSDTSSDDGGGTGSGGDGGGTDSSGSVSHFDVMVINSSDIADKADIVKEGIGLGADAAFPVFFLLAGISITICLIKYFFDSR